MCTDGGYRTPELLGGGIWAVCWLCHCQCWWRWFWIARFYSWLSKPPVPGVSASRAGLNLIAPWGFVQGCLHGCCLLPDYVSMVWLYLNWLVLLEVLRLSCCAVVVLCLLFLWEHYFVCFCSAGQTDVSWWVVLLWIYLMSLPLLAWASLGLLVWLCKPTL